MNYVLCPKGISKMPNIIVGNIYYIFSLSNKESVHLNQRAELLNDI